MVRLRGGLGVTAWKLGEAPTGDRGSPQTPEHHHDRADYGHDANDNHHDNDGGANG